MAAKRSSKKTTRRAPAKTRRTPARRTARVRSDVATLQETRTAHGLCLVIADRGWVWVGEVETDSGFAYIKGARTVRRWGTTQGVGQLASQGPTSNTTLDAPADMKVRFGAVIALVPCEQSKWSA